MNTINLTIAAIIIVFSVFWSNVCSQTIGSEKNDKKTVIATDNHSSISSATKAPKLEIKFENGQYYSRFNIAGASNLRTFKSKGSDGFLRNDPVTGDWMVTNYGYGYILYVDTKDATYKFENLLVTVITDKSFATKK